ncbi:hypothetical protein OQ470_21780, partial [Bacillus sp. AR11]|uniref:hypothetical protein n=1 Tax=Bacillus sp. AR11 TaxID=2994529 RepID=UPI002248F31B
VEVFMGRPSLDHEFDEYQGRSNRTQLWYTQWHVAMIVALEAVPKGELTPESLASLDIESIPDDRIVSAISRVNRFFGEAKRDHRKTVYQLTKSQPLNDALLKELGAAQRSWSKPPLYQSPSQRRPRYRTPEST